MLDHKLFTFLTVAERKSYTLAAQELHLTQPAVTQHVKKLEEYYKCRLIEMEGRSVHLTEAGKALCNYANLQLSNERQLKSKIQGLTQPMRIGATLSIADYYLPFYLKEQLKNERQSLQVSVGNTEALLNKLLHGDLDCAFIEGIFDTNLFVAHIFRRASFIPVVAANHPLAEQEISLWELCRYPLILREEGSGTRAILENYLYEHNISVYSFRRLLEIGSFGLIKQILAMTDGVTFLYEDVALEEIQRGELKPVFLNRFAVTRPLHFVYLKNSISQRRYEEFYHKVADRK